MTRARDTVPAKAESIAGACLDHERPAFLKSRLHPEA